MFYSGALACSATSPLYLLVVDPGDDPVARPDETIGWYTRKVLKKMPENWSANGMGHSAMHRQSLPIHS